MCLYLFSPFSIAKHDLSFLTIASGKFEILSELVAYYYYAISGCLIKLFASTGDVASWQIKLKSLVEKGVTDVWLLPKQLQISHAVCLGVLSNVLSCFARLCYLRL